MINWPSDFEVRDEDDVFVASPTAADSRPDGGDHAVTVYVPRIDDGAESEPDIEGLLLRLNTWERMRYALIAIRDYWNRNANHDAMLDACWYAVDTAAEALAAIKEEDVR